MRGRRALVPAIREAPGTAFLFVTRDLAMARCAADRVAVLEAGRLVEQGETQRGTMSPEHPCTRTLLADSESVC